MFLVSLFLSLSQHLKNSFSKTHYLPFNQLPITKSKGFRDEAGDKTRIPLFCPFYVWSDWKISSKWLEVETEQSRDIEYCLFDAHNCILQYHVHQSCLLQLHRCKCVILSCCILWPQLNIIFITPESADYSNDQ